MNGLDTKLRAVQDTLFADPALAAQPVFDVDPLASAALRSAIPVDPDKAGKARALSVTTGIPMPTVERNYDAVSNQQKLREVQDALRADPVLAERFINPQFAKIAHDEVGELTKIGQVMTRGAAAMGAAFPSANASLWGLAEAGADVLSKYVTKPLTGTILPQDIGGVMAKRFGEYRRDQAGFAKDIRRDEEGVGFVEKSVYGGLQSLMQNLMLLPATIATGNPGPVLYGMSGLTAGGAYGQARDKGRSVEQSLAFGVSQGAIEYATEKLPVAWLLKDLKVGTPFYKIFAHQIAAEVPGEQLATLLQDLNEWAVINPEKPFSSYLEERPSAAAQTLIATVIASGGQVATLKAVDMAAKAIGERGINAEIVEQKVKMLEGLQKLVASSKVLERDASSLSALVDAYAVDGPINNLHINAVLFQEAAGEQLPALLEAMPSVAAQLAEATALNGELVIPLGEALTGLANTGIEKAILDDVRFDGGGLTRNEAKTYAQEAIADFEKNAGKVLEEKEFDTAWQASAKNVEREFMTQLNTAGRFTTDVNKVYAQLASAITKTTAAHRGVTPEQHYVDYPLDINAILDKVHGGKVMDQREPVDQKTRADAAGFDTSTLWLHGTNAKNFKTFKVGDDGVNELGPGVYFTKSGMYADAWAGRGDGARHIPAYIKRGDIFDFAALRKAQRTSVKGISDNVTPIYNDLAKRIVERGTNPIIGGSTQGELAERISKSFTNSNRNKWLDLAGYIGGVDSKSQVPDQVVVFDPKNIRSPNAKFNPKDADSGNILSQDTIDNETGAIDEAPPYFSLFVRQIEKAKMNAAPAAQWKAFIKGLANKGVKKEEIEMSGVMEALDVMEAEKKSYDFAVLDTEGNIRRKGYLKDVEQWKSEGLAPIVKVDQRITKAELLKHLEDFGTRVETTILGEPSVPEKVEVIEHEGDYDIVRVADGFQLRDDSGNRSASMTEEEIRALLAEARDVPLPEGYSINEVEGGFQVENEDGEIVDSRDLGDNWENGPGDDSTVFETRADAIQAAREDYVNRGVDADDIDNDSLRERAQELLEADVSDGPGREGLARQYARESDSSSKSYNIALRPPTYEVVAVEPGGAGTIDLFTGGVARDHYRVRELTFDGLPDDDDVDNNSGGSTRRNKNMPDDADEFWEMFGEDATREDVGPQFDTEEAAHAWAEQNVSDARRDPVWIPWDGERTNDAEEDNEGEHEDWGDASSAADSANESNLEREVEYYTNNHEWDVDNYPRYFRLAREEIEEDDGRDVRRRKLAQATPNLRLSPPPSDVNPLQWNGQHQSDGGRQYREMPLWVPGVEPYNISDAGHFQTQTGGRTVGWARFKIHNDANGVPTMWIEEIQSQRAQAARENREAQVKALMKKRGITKKEASALVPKDAGFNKSKKLAQAEYQRLAEQWDALEREKQDALTAGRLPEGYNTIRDGNGSTASWGVLPSEQSHAQPMFGWSATEAEAIDDAIPLIYLERQTAISEQMREAQNESNSSVPRAPFTQETQAWTALVLKRLMRYAADNGITQIAWTPGLEQVDRYESALREKVDEIAWKKIEGGFIEIVAKKNGQEYEVHKFKEERLEGAIGEHMSQVILADPVYTAGEAGAEGVLKGDDIKLDDRWPAGYYGDEKGLNDLGEPSILTIVTNGVLKNLGGGSVKTIDITVTEKGRTHKGAAGFAVTPEMKGSMPLFQSQRGQISFGDMDAKGRSVISLLNKADLSTFIHELGHFHLEVLAHVASQPDAPAEIVADMNGWLKWFGIKDLATWNAMSLDAKRPYHEQLARGFEAYGFEGKAPSLELEGVFSRLRGFMISVYRALTGKSAEAESVAFQTNLAARAKVPQELRLLTDEVRGFFDRMIATNEEILEAQAQRGTIASVTAEDVSATTAEWKAYRDLNQEDTQEAVNQLQARSLRDMRWTTNTRVKVMRSLQREANQLRKSVEAEVTNEVQQQPIYAAQRFINANPANADPEVLHLVAERFGFTSVDHLTYELGEAQSESEVIDALTDKIMLERHGDLSSPDAISRATDKALHNDVHARAVITEHNMIAKAIGSQRIVAKAAKAFADQIIARKKIRDLHPKQYSAAEARFAKAAVKAKDLAEKAQLKKQQVLNTYAAKAAHDAETEIEKKLRYLKTIGTRESIDIDYRDQIDKLLERFELRQITNKESDKRAKLDVWIKVQEARGFDPVISDELRDEATRKPYREMTVEEFRGLVDAVKNIAHLGRLKNKLLTAADQRAFDAAEGDLVVSINDNAKTSRPEERSTDRGFLVSTRRLFDKFAAVHRKFASLARGFDGYKDGGVAWEYLVRNMNAAGNFEAAEIEKATAVLTKMLHPVVSAGRGVGVGDKRIGDQFTKRDYFPSMGKSFSREEKIGMLLNMGNEINEERVMTGEALSPQQARELFGTLARADAQFVNELWAYFESFRPLMADKERRVTGVEPEWVEAKPFTLELNTGEKIEMRGGYYPIAYDPYGDEVSNADINAKVQRQIQQGFYTRATTRRGHLQARTESTGRRLNYAFGDVITGHITQIIHDLAWHEYLIDANRLLGSAKIEHAVKEHYGVEVLREMKDTLKDVAIGSAHAEKMATFWNHIRYGTTIAGLGLNVFNSIQNMTGLTQAASRIGTKWVFKGAVHWAGDAARFESAVKEMREKSALMRERGLGKTLTRDIKDIRSKVSGSNSRIEAAFFWLQTKTQAVVDTPTWWGGYEKAMAEDEMTESKAVALADQAILDSQGGGQEKDQAGIQRGPAGLKLFTTFYSYFNVTFNLTAEAYGRTNFRKPKDIALFTADMVLLYSLPALLSTLLKVALSGDWDDEEKLKKKIIGDQISFALGTVVGLRELSAGTQAAFGVGEGFGYTGPAAARFFSDAYNLGKQIHQGEPDEAFWKALNNVGGVAFHYPSGQLNRTASGIAALSDGRTDNPGALLMGAPRR